MAEQRHKTTIEIGVDDRQIRGLDQTLHRAFDERMLATFERTLDRTARSMERMLRVAERLNQTMSRMPGMAGVGGGVSPGAPRGGAPGGAGGGQDLGRAITQLTAAIRQSGQMGGRGAPGAQGAAGPGFGGRTMATAAGTYLGGLGAAAGGGSGLVAQAAGMVPGVGGFAQSSIGAIQNYYQRYAASQQQIAGGVGTLGLRAPPGGRRGQRAFTAFGMDRPQAMGAAAGMARMGGVSGAGIEEGFMPTALSLQHLGGISEAPSIVGAVGIGRRGPHGGVSTPQSQQASMLSAVSAGIISGVRESRRGQFVAATANVLQQGRLTGANLGLQNVLQTTTGFAGLGEGFQGERAQAAAGRSIAAMRNAPPTGVGFAEMVQMRAAGYGNGRSWLQARLFMQTHPNEMIANTIREYQGMGSTPEVTAAMIHATGAQTGIGGEDVQQAISMANATPEQLAAFTEHVGPERASEFLSSRESQVGGAFRTPAREARHRNAQLSAGRAAAPGAVAIRDAELDILRSTLPAISTTVRDILAGMRSLGLIPSSPGAPAAPSPVDEGTRAVLEHIAEVVENTGALLGVDTSGAVRNLRSAADRPRETWDRVLEGISDEFGGDEPPAPHGTPSSRAHRLRQELGTAPTENGPGAGGPGASEPSSSAVDALRRIQRDAGIAADGISGMGRSDESDLRQA